MTMQPDSNAPLHGVRVLDLATGPLAAIGRHLAELGADVVRVEPRAGAADRHAGVLAAGVSLSFTAANLGKKSLACDLGNAADRAVFETLLGTADILIETTAPGSTDAATLGVAEIHRRHPALVILSASGFGAQGAYRDWQATTPVLHALSGELSRSGIPGRAPLLPPGDLALDVASPQAVFVILTACINRLKTGRGDLLDFTLLDAATQALDPGYGIAGSATAGVPASKLPRGRAEARHQYPIIPCADGYMRLCVLAPRQWQGMFEWMGRPEEFADPSYNTLQKRFTSPTLIPAIARFFADKTRAELEAQGQNYGVPAAAVLDLPEVLESAQIRARSVFKSVAIAPGVTAPFPDGLLEIDGHRAGLRGPAPAVGEHQQQVPASWAKPAPAPGTWELTGERPLSGLRVLDFGVIVVGAEQGRLLADQGAEVIKIENAAFPDGSRQTRDGSKMSVTFAAGHRNKLGLGLNLRDPEGKALFLQLVARSDVILSNFKPGTLESLGLGYDALRAINPRLIMADSSAFGPTGPWSKRLGYGPLVRASAGLTAQWRYPGEPDSFSDAITVYPDHVAGRIGAIGVLALLIRRLRTGQGGTVSVAQAEVMLSHMAPQIAARALEDAGVPLSGALEHDAPWGVFPAQGDDEWCVITVRNDADWQRFCTTIGREDLRQDAALATAPGRAAQRARIDQAVIDWLATNSPHDAMAQLQAAGVPAAAMLRVSELPAFPYYGARGFFREVHHPIIAAPFFLETAPVHSEHLPDPPERPAPLIGEHTAQIARTLLPEAEIARLIETKVFEVPEPAVPAA